MDIYNYDRVSGEYISTGKADPNPLEEGEWLIPAQATTVAPTAAPDGKVNVFTDGAWTQVDDLRGTEYWVGEEKGVIKDIGGEMPDGATLDEPLPEPAPPPSTDPNDYPLKRYQFLAMVEILGKEQAIMDAIAALPATSAIIARKRYENTHTYIRSDELFAQLAPAVGLTDEQVDAAWMQAKEF